MNVEPIPSDGGMLYAETNLSQYFPEPLNAITSLFFLAIAIYFTYQIKGKMKKHLFLTIALGLLYIGGIGGTIYHGLRQWWFFIMMDWVPILLLCLFAGVWFIGKLTRWYFAFGIVIFYAVFQYFARSQWQQSGNMQLFINVNYAVMGALVLFPVLGYLIKTKFQHGKWVGLALLAFIAALTFRVADSWQWLSFGTHFLWHTFGAVTAFCILKYVYLITEQPLETAQTNL